MTGPIRGSPSPNPNDVAIDDDDDEDEQEAVPSRKRRRWFSRGDANSDNEDEERPGRWGFLKGRRRSEGDERDADDANEDATINAPPSRSFVVIRERPGHPGGVSDPTPTH